MLKDCPAILKANVFGQEKRSLWETVIFCFPENCALIIAHAVTAHFFVFPVLPPIEQQGGRKK